MALQKTVTLPNGLVAEDAYHKITLAQVSAVGLEVNAIVYVTTYKDEAAADAAAPAILQRTYTLPFNREDSNAASYTNLYTGLLAHADFADAVSV